MKLIVVTRTRNEEHNIKRFVNSYKMADKVLVLDSGKDKTAKIARSLGAKVKKYDVWVSKTGIKRNPHGRQLNEMIDWATAEGADWIVLDDCDCVPNKRLQKNLRWYLEEADKQGLKAVVLNRIYICPEGYFPTMNFTGPSLYAFKPNTVRALDDDWGHQMVGLPRPSETLHIKEPECVLHYFYQSEERIEKKLNFYRKSGEQEGALHPKQFMGPIAPLKKYMR